MRGTYSVTMGDRGRLVVPAELRSRAGLNEGDPLVLIEADDGVVLLTRAQLEARVRADLAGTDLIDSLLADRRLASAAEDHTA
jgi:AbrB family looped-hinge helix DNA binding protein